MRTTVVSLAVIGIALAAIVAGYLSGQAGTRPPAVVQLRPHAAASVEAVFHGASDAAVDDLFSNDDVVVERPALTSSTWLPPRLSLVVGLVGSSATIDATFMRLDLPIAFDLDPHAADALRVARFIHEQGDVLLLHVARAPSRAELASLHAQFGAFDGIASRASVGVAKTLAGTGLSFFDERGDADPGPFRAAGVPFVARDVTVDDRTEPSYIAFMLDRAAMRSQRQGRLVVLLRPMPNSLAALAQFVGTRSAQIVALTQVP
ncbi:MAG TPA: divergent polysaccharide deacetylase family protein [Candidatus Baltobacteraceae bacterium]|nr:divergent polysaccharide deacetylase family protein [Candidatus Baltobacteraceae bacterium]